MYPFKLVMIELQYLKLVHPGKGKLSNGSEPVMAKVEVDEVWVLCEILTERS